MPTACSADSMAGGLGTTRLSSATVRVYPGLASLSELASLIGVSSMVISLDFLTYNGGE